MQTREEFKAEQAQEYRIFDECRSIADAMPIEPKRVTTSRGKARVNYKVEGLAGFSDLYQTFARELYLVPMCCIRKGTMFVGPLEWANEEDIPGATNSSQASIKVSFKAGDSGYGPRVEGKFYAMLPGLSGIVVEIDVDIEGPAYIGNYPALAPDREPINTRRNRHIPNRHLRGVASSIIRWAGGVSEDEGADITYFIADGVVESVHELRNAIGEVDGE